MMKKFALIFLIVLSISVTVHCKKKKSKNRHGSNDTSQGTASYLELRAYDETFYMNATGSCFGGAWASDSIPADCVCVRGVWALSTGYCDEDTVIYTGDGHCFQLNKKQRIRKMFNLDADKMNPFKPVSYLVSSSGHDFVTLRTTYRQSPHEEFGYMVRINPKHPMLAKRYDPIMDKFYDAQCTPALRKSAFNDKYNYIYISDVSGKSAYSLGSPGWCDKNRITQYWTLTVGQSFRLSDRQIIDGKMGKAESCPNTKPLATPRKKKDNLFFFGDMKKYLEAKSRKKGAAKSSVAGPSKDVESIDYKEAVFRARTGFSFDEYNSGFDLRWAIEGNDKDQNQQLEAQTKRLAKYHYAWALDGEKGPKVTTVQEVEYLKLAKKFLLTRCINEGSTNNEPITPNVVNKLYRWFQWAWRESLEVYPFQEFSDEESHAKIMEKLNMCQSANNYTMTRSYNPKCPPAKPLSITTVQGSINDTIFGILHRVADNYTEIQGDNTYFEPSIELAWKMLMILSYSCAEYFSDNPALHSKLNVRIESIFNPLLRKRWSTPGHTVKVMEAIFLSSFEPKWITDAVDACLVAAIDHSSYSKPLLRPIEESPLIFRGTDKPTKSTTTTTPAPAPVPGGEGKTRKRRSMVIADLWNLGNCIMEPSEPYTRFGARGRCIKEF